MSRATSVLFSLVLGLLAAAPSAARAQRSTSDTAQTDTARSADAPKPAPAPAAKPVAPALEFSAWLFGDYQYESDATAKAANGGSAANKFDIGRAYLTAKGPLGDRASFRLTTDIKQGAGTDSYRGWFVRLKYAFLQYDYMKPNAQGASAFARIGVLHTVVIDHEENFWPRYFAQASLEKYGFLSSADIGVSTGIALPNRIGEIYADVVNGTGYDNPENNKYKDVQARLTITPLAQTTSILKTLAITPWFSYGGNASVFLNDPANPVRERLRKDRYGIFVGNKDRRFTFGGEYAERKDGADENASDAALDRIVETSGRLYDAFVIARPFERSRPDNRQSFGLVARYDHWTPNADLDGYAQFILAGIFWEPTRKVALALDYQSLTPRGGLAGSKTSSMFLHWNLLF
jgi:hypothetical protein